jgi:hypothetical protein
MQTTLGPTGFRSDGAGKLYCEECGDWAHRTATGKAWCIHRWPGEAEDVQSYAPEAFCSCTGYKAGGGRA